MQNDCTRRRVIALGCAAIAPMAGCQTSSSSETLVSTHVLNATERNLEIFVEFIRPKNGEQVAGELRTIKAQSAAEISFEMPTGTYRFTINVDDVSPRPEKKIRWEVTSNDCTQKSYWLIAPAEAGLVLRKLENSC